MASSEDEVLVIRGSSSSDEEIVLDEQGSEKVNHCFSEPWGDSDLILVVEDEKFHVHRLILSLNSPVFRAMFKSEFKEGSSNEIPLPGKKADEMLDFLMKIYGPQYIKKEVEITMENVEQLMQLSDEYQVTEHIFQPCVEFLEGKRKTKENVMKILALAELYDLEKVCKDCNELLGCLTLEALSETVKFEDVGKDKLEHFLTQRIEVLEGYLEELYPQFMGLLECCLWLWRHEKDRHLELCSIHFSGGKANCNLDKCIKKCKACKKMLQDLALYTLPNHQTYLLFKTYRNSPSPNRYHFDKCLPKVVQKYSQLMTE